MKEKRKLILDIIKSFEQNPEKFKGTLLADLIMERKNLAVREEKYVEEIKAMQEQIAKMMSDSSQKFMKLKGAIDYLEGRILELSDEKTLQ